MDNRVDLQILVHNNDPDIDGAMKTLQQKEVKEELDKQNSLLTQPRTIPLDSLEDSDHELIENHSDTLSINSLETVIPLRQHPNSSKADATKLSIMAKEAESAAILQQEKLERLQNECQNLKGRVIELRQNLQDAQDHIFSLQPRQGRLTEKDAADEFKSLCTSIEEFVDRRLSDALDDKILTRSRVFIEPAKELLDLIPSSGKEAFQRCNTDEYNITAAIFQFLRFQIFKQNYYSYVGDEELARFMESVEKSMRNMEPQRDLIIWRTWRSETYSAIANRHEFPQLLQKRKELLTNKLTEMLELLLAQTADHRNLVTAVYRSIIEPAFSLAHKMHLSVDRFSIEQSPNYHLSSDRQKRIVGDLDQYELVDLVTRKKAQPSGNIEYIFDITPQLLFQSVKADAYAEPRILKKPKVLVAVTKEGQRHSGEPTVAAGSEPTVLGWLDRKMRHVPKERPDVRFGIGGRW